MKTINGMSLAEWESSNGISDNDVLSVATLGDDIVAILVKSKGYYSVYFPDEKIEHYQTRNDGYRRLETLINI